MIKGGKYNWIGQTERLVYLGKNGNGHGLWHQFAKVEEPAIVWCEVVEADLSMIEETPQPPPEPAPVDWGMLPAYTGYRLLKDSTHDERSIKEGQYSCTCCHCLRTFTGYKRSPVCEVCKVEPPVAVPPEVKADQWTEAQIAQQMARAQGMAPFEFNRIAAHVPPDAALAADPQQPVAWTSVKDVMPKSGVTVLVCYRNSHGNVRRIRAKWTPAKTDEANAEFDWGEYDEESDTYWTPEGWYECIDNWDEFSSVMVSEGEITHWMPLPLAPDDPTYTAPVAAPQRVEYTPNQKIERFNLDANIDGMDQMREFVLASDHDALVHALEANCDPAGMVQENCLLRDQTRQLGAMIDRLKKEAAQQREWVGLTAKQVNDVRRRFATNLSVPYFVMIYNAIDAALKEKNHG